MQAALGTHSAAQSKAAAESVRRKLQLRGQLNALDAERLALRQLQHLVDAEGCHAAAVTRCRSAAAALQAAAKEKQQQLDKLESVSDSVKHRGIRAGYSR